MLDLSAERHINENALCSIIGLTIETRPDRITENELKILRSYGVTRIQIGVQHTNDHILKRINRKCTTKDYIKAAELMKKSCFKFDIHIMPDLPQPCFEGSY